MENKSNQPPQVNPKLKRYWLNKMEGDLDFKNHEFPLAKIKRIVKFDPDVSMLAAEVAVVFSKASEMFIMDLTMRAWNHAQENKHRTIRGPDIAAAVGRTFTMDFLLDVVHEEEEPKAKPDHEDGELPPGMVIGTPVVDGSGIFGDVLEPCPGTWTVAPGECPVGEDVPGGSGGNGGN
ncbi:PREDICTED: nuclear transcription factor Y subunit C-5-like [Camelina sativa]|uniref:Nuclear transcription factor Y subunit C-5-like n=1 Tax=Camelina sativa TaxID=90675 RepID=A0ABM0XF48_CAMSA|nr:PREDICTED: nuclear transcription factor Y subunit C-5-like [Camelina sativa]